MPYGIRKSPGKNLYWVFNKQTGKKYSKKPIPRSRAEAQRRAIYASENGYKRSSYSYGRTKSRGKAIKGGECKCNLYKD